MDLIRIFKYNSYCNFHFVPPVPEQYLAPSTFCVISIKFQLNFGLSNHEAFRESNRGRGQLLGGKERVRVN